MASGGSRWYSALWRTLDGTLRSLSSGLKKVVRILRTLRVFLIIAVLTVIGSAIIGIVLPSWFPWVYLAATVFLVIPLVILLALVSLPLRAKSLVRLIDMGYPKNAKEMALRVVARKLHEESIESEELLIKTAWNESRKMARMYRERAQRVREELEREEASRSDDGPPPAA